MKSIFLKSIALSLIALSLWSCKKDETKVVATAGTAGALKSSVSSVIIDKSLITTDVIAFSLTKPDFGYQAAISNVLQFAVKGTNFASVKEFTLPANTTSKVFNGLDFNNLLLSLNLPTDKNSDIEVRLKSALSSTSTPVYSNLVSLNVKPFPLTSWIYLPGNYQGWDPLTADSLVSITGNGIYTGVVKMDGGNFKITTAKKWDIAYGVASPGKLSLTGGDISSVSAGYKLLTVDLNLLTYTIIDGDYWSLIGNAIPGSNWDKDVDMKSLNDGKNTWTITTALAVGEFKFRLNHDWGASIGNGADNIKITTAGNYKVTLTLNAEGKTGAYTVVKI
jgi:hypothetical protein